MLVVSLWGLPIDPFTLHLPPLIPSRPRRTTSQTGSEGKYPSCSEVRNSICQLWETFQKHDLQDSTFVSEFTSENNERLLQRYSEMLFACYFINQGFLPTSKNKGPDLCIDRNGMRIWIEIITPELLPPSGNGVAAQKASKEIEDYLTPPPIGLKEISVINIPTEQILLRWTAALKEKREKLTGYREKGIVKPGDIYVIAINSILLGSKGFFGISQWPNAAEATFAVGPIEIRINRGTSEIVSSKPSYRPDICNHNQSSVATDSFFNPDYKEVSALMATHMGLGSVFQPSFPSPLVLVHNPYAVNPLPKHFFKTEEEYVAEEYVAEDDRRSWEIRGIVGS